MAETNTQNPLGLRLSQLTDEELDYLLKEQEKIDKQTVQLTDEELANLFSAYAGPEGPVEAAPEVAPPQPPLTTGEAVAGGARELLGGATFELGDEAEALARAPFSDKPYSQLLEEIRQNRARFSQEYPGAALGLNLAGGIGSTFIPGVGLAGKTFQNVSRISKLASPVARTAATGAVAGGLSGVGAGETPEERLQYGLTGTALGGGMGAGFGVAGKGARWVGDVFSERGSVAADAAAKAEERAARLIDRQLLQAGMDPQQAANLQRLERSYGIPSIFGTSTPELAALTESVVQTPSDEQADLLRRLLEQQYGAPGRVESKVRQAIPTPDYFASEESILNTLRSNANRLYGAVGDVEVRDPLLMDLLNDPDIRGAYADALANVRRDVSAAKLRGEDPSQYELREIFDPILDDQGNLVGLSPTGEQVPDIKTLNQIKIALDRRIDSLYSSGQGGEATALKNLRNAFVDRLDEVGPPEYKAARAQYKGDIEIKEALETGRTANKLRWQEVNKLVKDFSPGELEAFKTGYVQRLMQGFEDTSRKRNFARELIDNKNQRKKLQALMDPTEFQVFEAALRREADLFDTTNRIVFGSPTYKRAAAKADIDAQLEGGNLDEAVNLMLNPTPGNIVARAMKAFSNMRNANVSRATYTQLARMLKAGTADEVDAMLTQLEAQAPIQQAADAALEKGTSRAASAAAKTIAPSPEVAKEELPEPGELQIPNIDQGMDLSGLTAMPGATAGVEGGPGAEGGTDVWTALMEMFPGFNTVLGDGSIGGEGFSVAPEDVAKALGVPLQAWLAYVNRPLR